MSCDCRWWDYVALPEDVDASDEDSFRQELRDLAFTVTMSTYHLKNCTFMTRNKCTNLIERCPVLVSIDLVSATGRLIMASVFAVTKASQGCDLRC